jgi:hypothetical protein
MILLAVAVAVFGFKQRERQRMKCLNNLRQIDSVIINLAIENRYYRGDAIPVKQIAECLVGNRIPDCPAGGHYTIPPVGGHPVCSHHGDVFAQEGLLNGPPSDLQLAIPERPGK